MAHPSFGAWGLIRDDRVVERPGRRTVKVVRSRTEVRTNADDTRRRFGEHDPLRNGGHWILGMVSAMCVGVACGTEPDALDHGVVRVALHVAESEPDDPLVGTASVTLALDYGACLREFYVDHPEWQQRGPRGASVFGRMDEGGEGCADRLCDDPDADQVDCEVHEIEQRMDREPRGLRIVFDVFEPRMQDKVLEFGPLPTSALAGCEDSAQPLPIVDVPAGSSHRLRCRRGTLVAQLERVSIVGIHRTG